jgi:mannose-6-phosphate isomerase-like protein (cupin superfamily)
VSASPFAFEPARVEKPWGHEIVFALSERYCGKVLFVRAGQALSLQYHEVKDEAWYVQSGRATLELGTVGDDASAHVVEIRAGDAFRFRPRTIHRVTALEDTTILEVSTPHLDDVVRLEDRYGREGTSAP